MSDDRQMAHIAAAMVEFTTVTSIVGGMIFALGDDKENGWQMGFGALMLGLSLLVGIFCVSALLGAALGASDRETT